jgi:ribulose-5-phosphate 4-epimerase/fuculose-1-phosphate aldolase
MAQTVDRVQELQEQCGLGAQFIWQELRDLYGHVSCRLPSGDGFLLKFVRVGSDPTMDSRDIQVYDYNGKRVSGQDRDPTELPIYTEIFRRRPDVQSVIHAHPHVATALSTTGKTIFAISHQSVDFGDGIPTFRGDMIDTVEIGAQLAETLAEESAILMKGHGIVVVGKDVPSTVARTIYVEQAAKQQIWASVVGTPDAMPPALREYHTRVGWTGATFLWHQLAWEAKECLNGRDSSGILP